MSSRRLTGSLTGKATSRGEERTADLPRVGMAADGYRWLHLRASQRGDVALRCTGGISAKGVNSGGPRVLSSMNRCDNHRRLYWGFQSLLRG